MADEPKRSILSLGRRPMDRREFARLSALLAGALALPACVEKPKAQKAADTELGDTGSDVQTSDATSATGETGETGDIGAEIVEVAELPTLGGAPDTHEGHVIAAFVDTVVPGRHRDPEGAAGGIDVGAPGMFFDPELPAAAFVGVLVLLLDTKAGASKADRTFDQLLPSERDTVLAAALAEVPILEFAIQLAKLAHFSSPIVGAELGYPGPNPGYVHDPNFTFGTAITTELTTDGNFA